MTTTVSYSIGYVARRTGLTSHTIRAWEKRYNAVAPVRVGSNRRSYSEVDLERLSLLKRLADSGLRIGNTAHLSTADLRKLASRVGSPEVESGSVFSILSRESSAEEFVNACVSAVLDLDAGRLLAVLTRATEAFSRPVFIDRIVVPFIYEVGDFWDEGSLRIAHEHLASAVLRTYLGDMLRSTDVSQSAPAGIFMTPLAQFHEFGALIAAVIAASMEWRAVYLGPNLPAEEIAAAADRIQVRLVGLSIVYPKDDHRLVWEIRKLRRSLRKGVTMIVGGRAAHAYEGALKTAGAILIQDTQGLRRTLESLRSEPGSSVP